MKKILIGLVGIAVLFGIIQVNQAMATVTDSLNVDIFYTGGSLPVSLTQNHDYFNTNAAFYQVRLWDNYTMTKCQNHPFTPDSQGKKVSDVSVSIIDKNGVETKLPIIKFDAPQIIQSNVGPQCNPSTGAYFVRVDSAPTKNLVAGKYSLKACIAGEGCKTIDNIDLEQTPVSGFKILDFSVSGDPILSGGSSPNLRAYIPYTKSFLTQNGGDVRPFISASFAQTLPEAINIYVGKNGVFEPLGGGSIYSAPATDFAWPLGNPWVYAWGLSSQYLQLKTGFGSTIASTYKNGNYDIKVCLSKNPTYPWQSGVILSKDGYDVCTVQNFTLKDATGTRTIAGASDSNNSETPATSTASASTTNSNGTTASSTIVTSTSTTTTSSTSNTSFFHINTSVVGSGNITGKKSKYKAGTTAKLKAKPSRNWMFTGWTGGGLTGGVCTGTSTSCSLVVDEDNKEVIANFAKIVVTPATSTSPTDSSTSGKICSINKTVFGGRANWKKVSCTGVEFKGWPSNLKRMDSATTTSSTSVSVNSGSSSNQSASATTALSNPAPIQPARLNPIANVWNAITGLFR